MALIHLHIYSEALGHQTQVNVVLPQKKVISGAPLIREGTFPCIYLLHGLGDDESIWMRRTAIERYADEYGVCMVMPNGGRSFYTDMVRGERYYTYVAKELPAIIRSMFRVSDRREDNFLIGNSMGGYGALKIALRECESFCAVAALSPVIDVHFDGPRAEYLLPIFGEDAQVPPEDDLYELIAKQEHNPLRPRIFIGVGTEDFLYSYDTAFRDRLSAMDYDFTYCESSGMHNWTFWDDYTRHHVLPWMLPPSASKV